MAPRILLRAILIPVLAALVFPHEAGARKQRPYRIAAGPYTKSRGPVEEVPAISRFTLHGLTVEVEHLDADRRLEFIRSLDPDADDPFGAAPGYPVRHLTFRVTFENGTDSDVIFQPGNVVMITDRKEQRFPIDMADLYLRAERASADDPQAVFDRISPLMYDGSTTIPSGHERSRLMVFGPMPDKWKELRLHFSFLQIGSETHTLSFNFHKQFLKD